MAKFLELIEQLRNPGENGLPDDFADQLAEIYTHDTTTADAKVSEVTALYETAQSTINQLKAHNYDLMKSLPSSEGGKVTTAGEADTDGIQDFSDMFETQ